MTNGDLLNLLTQHVKNYRKDAKKSLFRNNHMNDLTKGDKIPQKVIDALLVDFVNYVGMQHCVDWGLYTKDIQTSENLGYWEGEMFLSDLGLQSRYQLRGTFGGHEIYHYQLGENTFYIDFPRNEKGKKTGNNLMLFYCFNEKDFLDDKWQSMPVPNDFKELKNTLIDLGFKIK